MRRNLGVTVLLPRTGTDRSGGARASTRKLSSRAHRLVAGILLLVQPAYAQGKWVKLAPFPQPAEEISGAAAGGKMYVFAGLAPVWKPVGMVYEYDPATNQLDEEKADGAAFAPCRLHRHTTARFTPLAASCCRNPDRRRGCRSTMHGNTIPAADTWKALAPMPSKRGSALAAVVGDKIYVIGGATTIPGSKETAVFPTHPHMSVGTVEEYDPAANTWRERSCDADSAQPCRDWRRQREDLCDRRAGGAAFIGLASDISVVEEYDPATDQWSGPRARMPIARSALGAGVYGGRIYVAGGEYQDPHMMATFRAVEAYDPASNTWTEMPPMPVSRHGLAVGVIGESPARGER